MLVTGCCDKEALHQVSNPAVKGCRLGIFIATHAVIPSIPYVNLANSTVQLPQICLKEAVPNPFYLAASSSKSHPSLLLPTQTG